MNNQDKIVAVITKAKALVGLGTLAREIGTSKDSARKSIERLIKAGILRRAKPGLFGLAKPAEKFKEPTADTVAAATVEGPKPTKTSKAPVKPKPEPRWRAWIRFDFKYDIEGAGGCSIRSNGKIANFWAEKHYPHKPGKKARKERTPEWFASIKDLEDAFDRCLQNFPVDGSVSLGAPDEALVYKKTQNGGKSGFEVTWDVDKYDNYPVFMWTLQVDCSRKISQKAVREYLREFVGRHELWKNSKCPENYVQKLLDKRGGATYL